MEYKLLEKEDLELMKEIIEDDDIEFDLEKINEFYMNFFLKDKNGSYVRKEEYHYEKAYDIQTIKNLLQQSGLQLSAMYDAYTFEPPKAESQRIYVVAKEVEKTQYCDVLQEETNYER